MQDFIALILAIVFIVVSSAGFVTTVDKSTCSSSAEQNEVEYRWGFLAGCSYKHPTTGLWVPKDNYRAIGD